MPHETEGVKPLLEVHEPLGCHLQTINGVGGCFTWLRGAKEFDALLKPRHHLGGVFNGEFFTGTIVSFSDNGHPESEDHRLMAAELAKRGFKLLGIQDGAHGPYRMHLYGKGFTLPGEKDVRER